MGDLHHQLARHAPGPQAAAALLERGGALAAPQACAADLQLPVSARVQAALAATVATSSRDPQTLRTLVRHRAKVVQIALAGNSHAPVDVLDTVADNAVAPEVSWRLLFTHPGGAGRGRHVGFGRSRGPAVEWAAGLPYPLVARGWERLDHRRQQTLFAELLRTSRLDDRQLARLVASAGVAVRHSSAREVFEAATDHQQALRDGGRLIKLLARLAVHLDEEDLEEGLYGVDSDDCPDAPVPDELVALLRADDAHPALLVVALHLGVLTADGARRLVDAHPRPSNVPVGLVRLLDRDGRDALVAAAASAGQLWFSRPCTALLLAAGISDPQPLLVEAVDANPELVACWLRGEYPAHPPTPETVAAVAAGDAASLGTVVHELLCRSDDDPATGRAGLALPGRVWHRAVASNDDAARFFARHTHRMLGDDPAGWLLAVELLADSDTPLEELLTTARRLSGA